MKCPDHARDLKDLRCPMCHAELMSPSELETRLPGAGALLSFDPKAKVKLRQCPQCAQPMVPQRISKAEAFVERCPSCESLWVERADLKTLELYSKSAARQAAFASMSDAEKRELAQGLAEATHVDTGPDIGVAQIAAGTLGVPILDQLKGDKLPVVTWLYAAALVLAHVAIGPQALAYHSGSDDWPQAFTSGFAHFGWLHLIGNLLFLFAFGAAAEQKLPRPLFAAALLLLSPLTAFAQELDSDAGTLIGGASGVIAALLGLCLFLQPKARVTMFVGRELMSLPLWLYGVGWALMQVANFSFGIPGIGWLAHLSGFAAGLGLGFGVSRFRPA